jgi:hypothetical protein
MTTDRRTRPTRTTCYCEQCHRHFVVVHGEREAVYQVRDKIEDSHGAAAPECHAEHGLAFVRVAV